MDEAHRLKNSATVAYKFVQSLNSRFFLMLTATPIQNSLFELYNLVHLLQEGVLGTPEHFKDAFVADRHGRVLRQPERLNAILAHHSGKTVEEIARDTERDRFMSGAEAQAYGLIDSVLDKRTVETVRSA